MNLKDFKNYKKQKNNLLEDNCESLGAQYKQRKTGTFGLMSSSSFIIRTISTIEGGMISTDQRELYQILLSLRSHVDQRFTLKNKIKNKSKDDFDNSFSFLLPDTTCDQLIQTLLQVGTAEEITTFNKAEKKNASFIKIFKTVNLFFKEICYSSSFWLTFILKKNLK